MGREKKKKGWKKRAEKSRERWEKRRNHPKRCGAGAAGESAQDPRRSGLGLKIGMAQIPLKKKEQNQPNQPVCRRFFGVQKPRIRGSRCRPELPGCDPRLPPPSPPPPARIFGVVLSRPGARGASPTPSGPRRQWRGADTTPPVLIYANCSLAAARRAKEETRRRKGRQKCSSGRCWPRLSGFRLVLQLGFAFMGGFFYFF